MKDVSIFLFFILFFSFQFVHSQDYELNGYTENLQATWIPQNSDNWLNSNSITNRINFRYYLANFTFETGIRNILDYGDFVKLTPNYSQITTTDFGLMNLTFDISNNLSYALYSNIDRLFIDFANDKINFSIGRQRINLSKNMVWNPNDIFNTYNFFNFSYVERPGADAIQFEYFFNSVSSFQTVIKFESEKKHTYAGILKLNLFEYDFQILSGKMYDDFVFGFGWAGDIHDAGFTGEATYFHDTKNINDEQLLASIETNYTFPNSLYFSIGLLYNNLGTTDNAGANQSILTKQISLKNISPSRVSSFLSTAFQFTPLFRGSFSAIINPFDKSIYLGPSFDFSLTENIYINFVSQFFSGKSNTEFGDYGKLIFTQLKWNF